MKNKPLKALCLILVIFITLSCGACSKAGTRNNGDGKSMNKKETSLYSGPNAELSETPLSNTYKLLITDKKLTVGYIGGSITEGGSAEKMDGSLQKNYVNLTSKWFKDNYPDAKIETVNAGISDTGTNFGIFRLNKTLMNENGHDMPDLVFVEYTSNDWTYVTQSEEDLKRQIESLFLNIWQHNPYAEIVAVITTGDADSANRQAYKSVCDYYNIPMIDVGIALRKKIKDKIGTTNESDGNYYYTVDNLHPSHYGYTVYMTEIEKTLKSYLDNIDIKSKNLYPYGKKIPDAQNTNLILNPRILEAKDLEFGAVFKNIKTPFTCKMYNTGDEFELINLTESYLTTDKRGILKAEFEGNTIGIMFMMNKSGINMTYRIDNTDSKTLKVDSNNFSWQMYDHPQVFMLAHGLTDTKHTIQISFSPIDGSDTVNVAFGGLLVNQK